MKKLAKQTAVYGLSSILGKFLNWCLVPLYVRVLAGAEEYGVVTNLYAWSAFAIVILTYGMETGFFRFANKSEENPQEVYSSTLWSIGTTTLLFLGVMLSFLQPISTALGYEHYPLFVALMVVILAMDAFMAIPFAYLRYQNKAFRFTLLKLLFIAVNIGLNLFFLIICPILYKSHPETIRWFYAPGQGVLYILIANVIATATQLLFLLPEIFQSKVRINLSLIRKMVSYSFPLLILGVAGMINQTADKMLLPFLLEGKDAMYQLGIYGANFKVAVVMVMFTQAFRFAYEPFIFAKKNDDGTAHYADAMKYFVLVSLLIFVGIMAFIDILKFIISPAYYEGLKVVPIVMMAELFFGIYFNLSLWYKLSDQTRFGAYLSGLGCVLTVALNILFVPSYGYMACAWASFASYLIITILSYFLGQKYFPINYPLRKIGAYFALALVLFAAMQLVTIDSLGIRLLYRGTLFALFVGVLIKYDFPLGEITSMVKRVVSKR